MKYLIALVALMFGATTTYAADLALKSPVSAPVAAANSWAGYYIGLEGGMNLGKFSPFCAATVCGPVATEINLDDNNWFVGGHTGFLVQRGQIVFGPEVGVQYWGFKAKAALAVVETPTTPTLQTQVDWLAYVNMRAGITPMNGILVYVTGGPAWAHVKGDVNLNLANIDPSSDQSVFGWNVGGGVSFKLTDTITFGGEYRHYDFGKVSAANPALNLMGIGNSDRLTVDQAMARLSFRFN
jgi:outer membrane immunogenic protein